MNTTQSVWFVTGGVGSIFERGGGGGANFQKKIFNFGIYRLVSQGGVWGRSPQPHKAKVAQGAKYPIAGQNFGFF